MALAQDTIDDLFDRYGPAYRLLVTVSGMTAAFVMVLSSTIVNVAVPDVMGAYGVGQDQAQLMATAFNVAMTTSQLLNAWVVAAIGQRYGFVATLMLFTLGSVIAGTGETFGMVVFGRVLQGAAAGIVQPLVMVTIFQVFPQERRGFAMGIYTMGLVLAVAMGPPIGGLALEVLSWRYIFWLPLPLVAIALPLGLVLMPSVRRPHREPFDWLGYILVSITLFCIMTVLTDGPRKGWTSDYIMLLVLLGVSAGLGFVLSQRRGGATLLDVSLFVNPRFVLAMVITFTSGIGNFTSTYAFPVFSQLVQGLSPVDAGLILMPAMLLAFCMMPFTGQLADRLEPGKALMFGIGLLAVGTLPMAFADANTPYYSIVFYGFIGRFGSSFVQPFIMNTALKSLRPDQLNAGAGLTNFMRQTGGSLGTNAWVVFVDQRTYYHNDLLAATQDPGNAASRELIASLSRLLGEAGLTATAQHHTALHYLGEVVYAQGITRGFQDGFLVLVVVYLLAMIPAWILSRTRGR